MSKPYASTSAVGYCPNLRAPAPVIANTAPTPYAGCDSSNKPKGLDFLLLKLMNCFHFGGNQGRRAQMSCDELAKRLLPSTIRLKAFGELSLL